MAGHIASILRKQSAWKAVPGSKAGRGRPTSSFREAPHPKGFTTFQATSLAYVDRFKLKSFWGMYFVLNIKAILVE